MQQVLYQNLLLLNKTSAPLYISSACSQQPATCPYPNSSNSCPCIFYKVHFNSPPSTPRFSKWFFPSGTQPRSCIHVLFNLCRASSDVSQNKGPLKQTNAVWPPVRPYWHPNWRKLAGRLVCTLSSVLAGKHTQDPWTILHFFVEEDTPLCFIIKNSKYIHIISHTITYATYWQQGLVIRPSSSHHYIKFKIRYM